MVLTIEWLESGADDRVVGEWGLTSEWLESRADDRVVGE